jgi:hypothetical protein
MWCETAAASVGHNFLRCDSCSPASLGWGGFVFMVIGFALGACGAFAGMLRSDLLCLIHAVASFSLAFILALASIVIGLETAFLKSALDSATGLCFSRLCHFRILILSGFQMQLVVPGLLA